MSLRTIAIAAFALIALASAASADVHVWSHPDPVFAEPISVDMDAAFTGIVSVQVHMAGFGGGQFGWCEEIGGGYEQNFPLQVTLDLDGATAVYVSPYMQDYEVTFDLELTPEQPDWTFLEDGAATLNLAISHTGEYDNYSCYATGYEILTAPTFEIIVTAGAVPTEAASWTAIKSLYR